MFACMREPAELFGMVSFLPVEIAARGADQERCMKINEQLRFGDDLPHGLHVRMFLRDVATTIAMFFKAGEEGGFARAAWPDDTDKRVMTCRLHKECCSSRFASVTYLPND